MSKYYKAEDVIRAIAEHLCWEAQTEYGDKFTTEDWLEEAEDYVSDLPTYKVADLSDEAYEVGYTNGQLAERKRIVHCKDCFHYTQRTEHTGICDFWNAGVAFKDFCSMANQEPMVERIEE